MVGFVCTDCGFRFESEEGKSCPYCGGASMEKEKSAEELIKDVNVE
jgi:DNA-directed RNA polymerase subunit RPC12/RpoP